ncbi:altronate dehydratase, partial [Pseudoflavonifractor sp. MCC625]
LIGQLSDLMVREGGTSILSETTEFIGAEHILARRAATPEVRDRIFEIVHRYEEALRLVGEEVREGNPSPGNKTGGITTLEEKSLGCIHKGGHSPVNAV